MPQWYEGGRRVPEKYVKKKCRVPQGSNGVSICMCKYWLVIGENISLVMCISEV